MAGSGGSGGGSVGGGFSGGSVGGFSSGGFRHTSFINSTRHFSSGGGGNGTGPVNPITKIGFYIIIGIIALSVLSIMELGLTEDVVFYEDEYYQIADANPYFEDRDNYIASEKLPLEEEYCIPVGVYVTDNTEDEIFGRIDGPLEKTLMSFYDKTGIEPHVCFFDYPFDGYLYDTALDLYYELYEDEGHLLLALACDTYDYEYEIIIGDDTRRILTDDALEYFSNNIDCELYSADYGVNDSIMDSLCNAFSITADEIMFEYTYIGNIVESVSPDESEEYIPDGEETEDVPATTEKDAFEEFIENEFGSHETTDELDEIFGRVESYMEEADGYRIIAILLIIFAFGCAVVIAIAVSGKRNNYEPDSFGESRYDNYDEKFSKKDSRYDDYMK